MSFSLEKNAPRLWSLVAGRAMVVTDIHGNWDAYCRYRDRFIQLQSQGLVECLIFTGDLIHAEDPAQDRSIEIVLDILSLRRQYGDAIIYLCGNHELPHIYGISLAKGDRVFTPDFEKAMVASGRRTEIIALFQSLPFYIRTAAGVSVTHAGAPAIIAEPETPGRLFNWSHQSILQWADGVIINEDIEALRTGYERHHGNIPYHLLARYFLAVSGPEDPRFDDLLRGFVASSHPWFEELLWPALFTRNEQQYGSTDYGIFLDALLQALSADFSPQHTLVAGHIPVRGGYEIVAKRHFRLASAEHANPNHAGNYLLFDSAQPVQKAEKLRSGLGTVYK
jgi:hypothetical protein